MNNPSMASSTLPVIVQTPQHNITAEPIEFPIILNKIHSWVIHIDDTTGQPVQGLEFQIKGGMPAHQHGLPTQPELINEPKPGEYIIDGVKFNMYGTWRIELIDLNPNSQFHHKIEFDLDHDNTK